MKTCQILTLSVTTDALPYTDVQHWKCLKDPPQCRPQHCKLACSAPLGTPTCCSPISLHPIASHHIPSHPITSHCIPSHPIPPHPMAEEPCWPSAAVLPMCLPAKLAPEPPPPRQAGPRTCSPSLGPSLARLMHLPPDSSCMQRQRFCLQANKHRHLAHRDGWGCSVGVQRHRDTTLFLL